MGRKSKYSFELKLRVMSMKPVPEDYGGFAINLEKAMESFVRYYNYGRYQENLNCMTPMEYHEFLSRAA